jgi:hypothetical protein
MQDLPKFKNKIEAKKTTNLVKWIKKNIKTSGLIEIKIAKQLVNSEAVYLTQFKNHQIENLKSNKYTEKIKDFGGRNCADVIHFYNMTNYIILCFKNINVLINAKNYPFDKIKINKEEAILLGTIIR